MDLAINFLLYQDQLKIETRDQKKFIFDPIRKRWMVLTPEEMIRQLVIIYLLQEKNIPISKINVEKQLIINERRKRFDIIIYNQNMHPFLLVECKAPKVPITQDVFYQISQYNHALKADYLMVSNGIQTHCCKMDYTKESFEFIDKIPSK